MKKEKFPFKYIVILSFKICNLLVWIPVCTNYYYTYDECSPNCCDDIEEITQQWFFFNIYYIYIHI